METIILIMSIICFLTSAFCLVAKVTGGTIAFLLAKLIGLVGVICPVIYWLKIANVI